MALVTQRPSILAFISLVLLFSHSAIASPYSELIVFGDSLSDNGNLFTATGNSSPPAPYYQGRFSNGEVYSEILAAKLGAPVLQPALLGGSNYAWAGAFSADDFSPFPGLTIPSIDRQVQTYLSTQSGIARADSLHIVFAGGNDLAALLDAGLNGVTGVGAARSAAANIITSVNDLISAGADAIVVPNLPDLGLTPRFQALASDANALTREFNSALAAGLFGLEQTIEFDTFAFLLDARTGFIEPNDPCFTGFTLCGTPEEHLFFDDFHPTHLFYQGFANALQLTIAEAQAVPEPAIAILFGLGIMMLFISQLLLKQPRTAYLYQT